MKAITTNAVNDDIIEFVKSVGYASLKEEFLGLSYAKNQDHYSMEDLAKQYIYERGVRHVFDVLELRASGKLEEDLMKEMELESETSLEDDTSLELLNHPNK